MLHKMCEQFGIPFRTEMIAWPQGKRDSDGVWGKHWYDSVWRSSGFAPYRHRDYDLPPRYRDLADAARPYYDKLYRYRLTP